MRIQVTTDYLQPGDSVDRLFREQGHDTTHSPATGIRPEGERAEPTGSSPTRPLSLALVHCTCHWSAFFNSHPKYSPLGCPRCPGRRIVALHNRFTVAGYQDRLFLDVRTPSLISLLAIA